MVTTLSCHYASCAKIDNINIVLLLEYLIPVLELHPRKKVISKTLSLENKNVSVVDTATLGFKKITWLT